jgi:hypothetical protein
VTETTTRVATRDLAGISRAAIVDADRAGDRVLEAVEAATLIHAGVAVDANSAADLHPRAVPADPAVPAASADPGDRAVPAGPTVEAGHRPTDRETARRILASRGKSVPAAVASAFVTRAGRQPRVGHFRRPIGPAGVFPSVGEAHGRSVHRRASHSGSGTSHSRPVSGGQLGANLRTHLVRGRRHPAHGRSRPAHGRSRPAHGRRQPPHGHTRRVHQGTRPGVESNRHRRI